ncbi:Putative aminophospholipid-translocase [Coccidioides posadasii str. Silveira]|uniref:Phospholipid-transporting ATPase n=1 Tax=Coccidioides posadasii (strain RMSCC 757 / Silveira) TaxID=443226 RepID=E9D348_COCPS|nr:phospholipid-translocating P-type ATPase [Coccidioides posadasii str. Silveira]QVM12609.1 Putative aminophospholipid-translocase [Coccidioides posadasii str. Silveira]
MTSSHSHRPLNSRTPSVLSDSDDDLDLEELGAGTSRLRPGHDYGPSRGHERNWSSPGIALRNIRTSARNRLRNRGLGSRGQQLQDDDLDALLFDQEDDERRLSRAASSSADDNAPLLSGPNQDPSSRHPPKPDSFYANLGSKLRIPGFNAYSSPQDPRGSLARPTSSEPKPTRLVLVGQQQSVRYPANIVSNAKYTAWSFLPRTLYNEFSFFFNIYFLLVALSQIIPVLRIGYMSSYIAPLAFVVTISLGKEALDDIARRRRDSEANSEEYTVLTFQLSPSRAATVDPHDEGSGPFEVVKKSKDLKVGDILKIRKNQRLPADVVVLQSLHHESSTSIASNSTPNSEDAAQDTVCQEAGGSVDTFIRTDQLDGETDWKLRIASPLTQTLPLLEFRSIRITAGAPERSVNEFVGRVELAPTSVLYDSPMEAGDGSENNNESCKISQTKSAPLTIDNTAWANTVLASNTTTLACVIYTGPQTRSAMSTSPSRSKVGLLEYEINSLTKILCVLTLSLSIILVALEGFQPTSDKKWYIAIMVYLILFSTIIPMSLRVNLDMAKSVYGRFIERDKGIPDTIVRTSTIPEDLGRIEYLLSDKTGTLTQNEMELKKIHVGTVSYANEAMEEVAAYVRQGFSTASNPNQPHLAALVTPSSVNTTHSGMAGSTRTRREISSRVRDLIMALVICHNVTPTLDEKDGQTITTYQASSPDEIAIVKYAQEVGVQLAYRDRQKILLRSVETGKVVVRAQILDIFPFTSESKRMGIVVQFSHTQGVEQAQDEIWFFQKGADTVMSSIVATNDWLDEETANMAREGLRTLVVGRKRLSQERYHEFSKNYKQASLSLSSRDTLMAKVVHSYLECNLELLGVTGVEDKLQKDVKPSLELLRNAGVKIWMLTGDKIETARCVAVSSKLVSRGQYIHTVSRLKDPEAAQEALDFLRNKTDACLLIDGDSLTLMLSQFRTTFISIAVLLPTVIACRCSPTQKAEIALLIRRHTKKRVCCIGDGGNDVSMIQAADVGIGIVGKEGRQASLAADFSITQFHHLTKLLVWHGRNSYKRSAKLAQFIMHRGLIISACQTMYSIAKHFEPKGLFINWLLVGYATVYTNAPVFSLVLDRDVDEELANLYPELYKELKSGRSLSYRSFFTWVLVSVYQGSVIQGFSQILVDATSGPRLISVSFTALVLNELAMVAISITTWHPIMIFCIIGTGLVYAASVPFLGDYFDLRYVVTVGWVWRVAVVCAISLIPVWAVKLISRTWSPPNYRKVRG